ncbi:hypothetical protein ASG98_18025 [Bacillus sp. Soil531]|nr:hypothetical protein ASG98_18025 [Bacillus sp. Soil531]
MRRKIIRELADSHEKEEHEILNILKEYKEITPYVTKIIKGRKVIDKSKIIIEEQIVLDYYKLLLNRYCNISFPNRSYIMTELMNLIPHLNRYNKYTIYKFDFKDFFYSINSKNIFKSIFNSVNLKTSEFQFLRDYTDKIQELTPGIGLHNSLIEINGDLFDLEMKKKFNEGFLYYARYVDDCILILDEKIAEDRIEKEISELIKKCFGSKMKVNGGKTQCFHSDCVNFEIDYLGYVFQKGQAEQSPFKFGVSRKKLEKYTNQINDIVLEYADDGDIEALNLKLELIFKRIVYYGKRSSNKKYRWQVRGISDSYKELKRFMKNNEDYSKITKQTESFFKWSIERSFKKNKIEIPAKIKNQLKNKKFISCFLNNRALLLHQKIGLSHSGLKNKLSIVYKNNVESFNYSELANKLLGKIK